MDPLLYGSIGLLAGLGIALAVTLLMRRRDFHTRFEALERTQERGERLAREEAARAREESANAAKAQREELTDAL